jgi:acyl CoA:acetate/3-ketoacid CoA transferase beta subunit
MSSEYSVDEQIAVCIARCVEDGEVLAQGINTPLVMAGYLLARLTHAPNVRFASAIGQSICQDWSPMGLARVEDQWLRHGLLHVGFVDAAADLLPQFHPKEFFRPGQVDAQGNFNNVAIGRDYGHPRLRLPGTGGIPDVSPLHPRLYLYVPRHSRVTFVQQIDFVSGMGYSANRQHGHGPHQLVSDLGVFDWVDGCMRVVSVHLHASLAEVRKKTGFALIVPDAVPVTPPPSAEEQRLLRTEIDPLGVRQLELLSGTARKAHLRAILQAEGAWD